MIDPTKQSRPARRARLLGVMAILLAGCGDGATTQGPPGGGAPPGPEGPQGPPADPDEPSITAVTPAWVWLSRSASISIGGYNTDWDSSTSVDFGAGITVEDVVVASPTSLVATVSIDTFAAVGARDVVVTSGDVSVTHAGAFQVRPGADVSIFLGDGTQGSFNVFAIDLHDAGHTLTGGIFDDPTQQPTRPFSTVLGGAAEEILPFQELGPIFYDEHFALISGFLDVTAPATAPISVITDPGLSQRIVSTGVVDVLPNTAEAITLDTVLDVPYGSEPLATKLLRFTNDTGEDALFEIGVSNGDGGEPMAFRYARHSGRISDGFVLTVPGGFPVAAPARDGEDIYLMAFAPEGEVDFTFQAIAASGLPATFFASDELDDDECENAQNTAVTLGFDEGMVIDGGVFTTGGSLLDGDEIIDVEWYRFSVLNDGTSVTCTAHTSHDVAEVSFFSVADCDAAVTSPLDSGDYYVRVASSRELTTHGPEHYALLCYTSAAP